MDKLLGMPNNQSVPGATVHINEPNTTTLVKITRGKKIKIIYPNATFEEVPIIPRPPKLDNVKNLPVWMECGDNEEDVADKDRVPYKRTHAEFLNMRNYLCSTAQTALGALAEENLKWADVDVKIKTAVVEELKTKYPYLHRFSGDWATLEMFRRNLRNVRSERNRKPRKPKAAPGGKTTAKVTKAAVGDRSHQDKRPAGGSTSTANRQTTSKAASSDKNKNEHQPQTSNNGKGKAPLPRREMDESTHRANEDEDDGDEDEKIEPLRSPTQVQVIEEEEEEEEDGDDKSDGKKDEGDDEDEDDTDDAEKNDAEKNEDEESDKQGKGDSDDEEVDQTPRVKRPTRRVKTVVESDSDSELSEAPPSSTIRASSTVTRGRKGGSVSSTLVGESTPPGSPVSAPTPTKKRKAADKSDIQTVEPSSKKQKTPDEPEPPAQAPPKTSKKTKTAVAPSPPPEPTTTKTRRAPAPLAVTTRRQAAKYQSMDASEVEKPEESTAAPKPKETAPKKRKGNAIEREDSWSAEYNEEVSSLPPPPPPKKKKATAPSPSDSPEPEPSKPTKAKGKGKAYPKIRPVPEEDEPAPITTRAAKQELIESTESTAATGAKAKRGKKSKA